MLYNTYSQKRFGGQIRTRKKERSSSFMNIMVAGSAGTGKTMFVQTLCKHFRYHGDMPAPTQPTQEVYSVSLTAKDDDDRQIALTIVDTPGFTDELTVELRVRDISKYIDHQFQRTLAEESKVKRDAKALDTHMHALLYFVDPILGGKLTDMDRFALRALSSRANVIPVVGKSDMLSLAEWRQVKQTVREEIFNDFNIPVYGNVALVEDVDDLFCEQSVGNYDVLRSMFQESSQLEDDDEAQAFFDYLEYVPFSVIGCEESSLSPGNDADDGDFVGRRLPWAVIDCFSPKHCDLTPLVSMLLTIHRDMLRISTFERFYERYRTRQLLQRRISRLITLESNGNFLV